MNVPDNPYASALDGLKLDDPVAAFFNFCREREQIRVRRESGLPAPWSDDPIFQKARFLNVFREDDRGSRAILRFAAPFADDLPMLVRALFFARWCNRQTTLDQLNPELLRDVKALRRTLEGLDDQPWCNVTAYPVEPVRWEGVIYSRFDTATTLFDRISEKLTDAIGRGGGDVVQATREVNQMLGMRNDFPVFMAVMDVAWFQPAIIDPASHVPTGIGAVAYLDRLQKHLGMDSHAQTCERMIQLQSEYWPEARRPFQPIDIEYLSCECRKYYSYVNGTKQFEGKNIFQPGQSASLTFDVASEDLTGGATATKICVIAGAPCSGKSTLISALEQAGYRVERETAEKVLRSGIDAGQTAEELRADPVQWQMALLRADFELFDGLPTDQLVFTDTSFLETLVFSARAGVSVGPNVDQWLQNKRYKTVFFLEPVEAYEQSEVRIESQTLATQLSEQVRAAYSRYGYALVEVPAVSVEERLAFIKSQLGVG